MVAYKRVLLRNVIYENPKLDSQNGGRGNETSLRNGEEFNTFK